MSDKMYPFGLPRKTDDCIAPLLLPFNTLMTVPGRAFFAICAAPTTRAE